jgi:isocitrate lyase
MECPLVIVARTDSEAAKYIMSNHDPIDQPFIMGQLRYRKKGDAQSKWTVAGEFTLGDAIKKMLEIEGRSNEYQKEQFQCGWNNALPRAKELVKSHDFEWDPEVCRAKEGYYRIKGGVEFSIARGYATSRWYWPLPL